MPTYGGLVGSATSKTSGTTLSFATTAVVPAGSTLIVWVVDNASSNLLTTATVQAGSTALTRLATTNGNSVSVGAFALVPGSDLPSGTTITITWPSSVGVRVGWAEYWTGLGSFSASGTNTGLGTTVSGSVTVPAGGFALAAAGVGTANTASITWGTGITGRSKVGTAGGSDTTNQTGFSAERGDGSGSFSGTISSGSKSWSLLVLAFNPGGTPVSAADTGTAGSGEASLLTTSTTEAPLLSGSDASWLSVTSARFLGAATATTLGTALSVSVAGWGNTETLVIVITQANPAATVSSITIVPSGGGSYPIPSSQIFTATDGTFVRTTVAVYYYPSGASGGTVNIAWSNGLYERTASVIAFQAPGLSSVVPLATAATGRFSSLAGTDFSPTTLNPQDFHLLAVGLNDVQLVHPNLPSLPLVDGPRGDTGTPPNPTNFIMAGFVPTSTDPLFTLNGSQVLAAIALRYPPRPDQSLLSSAESSNITSPLGTTETTVLGGSEWTILSLATGETGLLAGSDTVAQLLAVVPVNGTDGGTVGGSELAVLLGQIQSGEGALLSGADLVSGWGLGESGSLSGSEGRTLTLLGMETTVLGGSEGSGLGLASSETALVASGEAAEKGLQGPGELLLVSASEGASLLATLAPAEAGAVSGGEGRSVFTPWNLGDSGGIGGGEFSTFTVLVGEILRLLGNDGAGRRMPGQVVGALEIRLRTGQLRCQVGRMGELRVGIRIPGQLLVQVKEQSR